MTEMNKEKELTTDTVPAEPKEGSLLRFLHNPTLVGVLCIAVAVLSTTVVWLGNELMKSREHLGAIIGI